MPQFQEHGMKELWMQAGPSHAIRYIPLHLLHARMGNELCKVLPALYTLTGCDWTSKVGTKKSALEADAETLLQGFGKYPAIVEAEAKQAEKFLVNVLKRNSSSDTFTMLRKEIYPASPTRTHSDLPPTSYGLKPHLQRANFNTYLITNKSAHTRTPYDEHISGGLWIRADWRITHTNKVLEGPGVEVECNLQMQEMCTSYMCMYICKCTMCCVLRM